MATVKVNSVFTTKAANGDLQKHYLATNTAMIADAGQPNGVPTLDANGNLVQMPTLAQVGGSNKNLLHNAYWTIQSAIVNQRTLTVFNSSGYSIDRWVFDRYGTGTLSVTNDGLVLTAVGNTSRIRQPLENWAELSTVTLSIICKDVVGANRIEISAKVAGAWVTVGGTDVLTAGVAFCTGLIPSDTTELYALIITQPAGSIKLLAAKLEHGSNSTIENDPPPDPQQELAKCQRFFEVLKPGYYGRLATIVAFDAINAYGIIPITPKRTNPAIAYLEGDVTKLYLNQGSTYTPLTSLELVQMHNNYIFIKVQVASGLTANASYVLRGKEGTVVIALDSSL